MDTKCFMLLTLLFKLISSQRLPYQPIVTETIIESSQHKCPCKQLASVIQNTVLKGFTNSAAKQPLFGQIVGPLLQDIAGAINTCPCVTAIHISPEGYTRSSLPEPVITDIIGTPCACGCKLVGSNGQLQVIPPCNCGNKPCNCRSNGTCTCNATPCTCGRLARSCNCGDVACNCRSTCDCGSVPFKCGQSIQVCTCGSNPCTCGLNQCCTCNSRPCICTTNANGITTCTCGSTGSASCNCSPDQSCKCGLRPCTCGSNVQSCTCETMPCTCGSNVKSCNCGTTTCKCGSNVQSCNCGTTPCTCGSKVQSCNCGTTPCTCDSSARSCNCGTVPCSCGSVLSRPRKIEIIVTKTPSCPALSAKDIFYKIFKAQ